jgi:gas vesicle protein
MANHHLQRAAVGGFVTGVLAGGALGLLLAPASGRMIRARANQRLRETTESARELKDRVSLRFRETAGAARGLKEKLGRRLRSARRAALGLKRS